MSRLSMLSAVEIATERVLLRKARDTDRERLIELQTDPEVWAYLGGPRLREAVEQRLDEISPHQSANAGLLVNGRAGTLSPAIPEVAEIGSRGAMFVNHQRYAGKPHACS